MFALTPVAPLRGDSGCEPVDYLATVGYWHVLHGRATPVADEDDPESVADAMRTDHRIVFDRLKEHDAEPRGADKDGAKWGPWRCYWPDFVPGLKTWAGRLTLAMIIAKYQSSLTLASLAEADGNLMRVAVPLVGVSGLDRHAAGNAVDIGFSPNDLGMPVYQRVAVELLAIIGLSTVPLVSWDTRECGWMHDGKVWRMTVEHRAGYYYRWGHARVETDLTHAIGN